MHIACGPISSHRILAAGYLLDMTMMGPFLPYPAGEDEYRVAAADPGAGAPPPAPGFGEAEGEPDLVDDTPEPGSVDPVPERPAAEIPFRTPNPNEIGLGRSAQGGTDE
jgi:hypothetical protein